MSVATAKLNAREERRLRRGHCWCFRNEFARLSSLEDGQVVDVLSNRGAFIGRGFYQAEGGIAVRLLAHHQVPIDARFLRASVDRALRFRERCFPETTVYRWVFGESDGLPGFVADRYGAVVAAQTSCAFYSAHADALAQAFLDHEGVRAVRTTVRGDTRWYGDGPAPVVCDVDGVQVGVDLDSAQKTGLFLDQRINCREMRRFAPGTRVLDGHCYVGVWSCHAARAGAASVLGVDTSAQAVESARENAGRNGLDARCTFETADIADVLQRDARYDLVILDPPALAKSRSQTPKALKAYQALNRDAMRAIDSGGILVTSSCSHFVDGRAFLEVLKRAAAAAQCRAWILDVRGAGPDHPVLLAMPETAYLTCVTLRVL